MIRNRPQPRKAHNCYQREPVSKQNYETNPSREAQNRDQRESVSNQNYETNPSREAQNRDQRESVSKQNYETQAAQNRPAGAGRPSNQITKPTEGGSVTSAQPSPTSLASSK